MKIKTLISISQGKLANKHIDENEDYHFAFASDLMSDVLRLEVENLVLVTGLCNLQTIRTSEMADISCVILCRAKKTDSEMKDLADLNNISIIETDCSIFKTCGILYNNNIKPVY